MNNKVYVDFFRANDPDLSVEDIISDVRVGTTAEGVIILSFNTKDKYVDIDDSVYVCHPTDYEGYGIKISPHITLENDDGDEDYICESECYLPWVPNEKIDRYHNHPKFYTMTLVVDGVDGHTPVVSALKHQYRIAYIPFEIAYNSECLQSVDLQYPTSNNHRQMR